MPPLAYRVTARLVQRLPLPPGKLALSVRGRQRAVARWLSWASQERTDGPRIWVHGASVGEALAAEPVVRRMRAAIPNLSVVHSYSSPSVVDWPPGFHADHADFLPPEDPSAVAAVLSAVRPSLLVYARGDLWAELTGGAHRADIPIAVVGASVRQGSARLRQPMKTVLRRVYDTVAWLGAISHADAERWTTLGVRHDVTEVTGDPRHDQVIERVLNLSHVSALLPWKADRCLLVAGSTHAQDEAVLLPAFRQLLTDGPDVLLLVAPHDVSQGRIAGVLRRARELGIRADPWQGEEPRPEAQCLVATTMGTLADLYAAADIAYVGGAFSRGGLHAVIEPAAYALPILVGPKHGASHDAEVMLRRGGAFALSERTPVEACRKVWGRMVHSPGSRASAGLAARQALTQGAADRSTQMLIRLLRHR